MPDVRTLYDSEYLAAYHLPEGKDVTVTIVKVVGVELPVAGTSQKQRRPVLFFDGKDKGMVLNKVNSKTIAAMYGHKTEEWTGKKITLYATKVKFGPDMVDAIRVRAGVPK